MKYLAGFNLRTRDLWIVSATLIITLMISVVAYVYSKNVNEARNQSRFEALAIAIEHDLTSAMLAYGQVLRGGVAFFNAKSDVTREEWRTYVENLKLEESYPGIQALSYNAVFDDTAAAQQFEARVRRTDWPEFTIKPKGDRDRYVLIHYVEPLTAANESVLGFDVYSEPNRRKTIDQAIATGDPHLTAKITLVQENEVRGTSSSQAGALLILPVSAPSDDDANGDAVTGLVVGVFRMGDLVTDVLKRSKGNPSSDVEVTLYDASEASPDAVLFGGSSNRSHQAHYATSTKVNLFGRDWLITSHSTQQFEARVATQSHNFLLITGVLASVLLTLLVWGQAIRYRDSLKATERLQSSNSRIVDLMGEVNHRSKNLLGVVQSIARQTNSQDPVNFTETFSLRLGALSASQDILVKNNWAHVGLDELVRSQLSHHEDLIGERIRIEGPEIRLSAAHAQTIGMTVHELATNASKFGALSNIIGKVDIGWDIDAVDADNPQFRMWWIEARGPSVVAPDQTGFGSKVTGAMMEFALSGDVTKAFKAQGFEWRFSCPAATIRNLPHVATTDDGALVGA